MPHIGNRIAYAITPRRFCRWDLVNVDPIEPNEVNVIGADEVDVNEVSRQRDERFGRW